MLVCITALVPETYSPVLLRHRAIKIRKDKHDERWKAPIEVMNRSILQTVIRSCYRPFLLLALEPMVSHLFSISSQVSTDGDSRDLSHSSGFCLEGVMLIRISCSV